MSDYQYPAQQGPGRAYQDDDPEVVEWQPVSEPGAQQRGAGLLAVVAGIAILLGGGTLLQPAVADPPPAPDPVIGRTHVVCPAPPTGSDVRSVVQAVANKQENEQPGTLSGTAVGTDKPAFQVTDPGKGVTKSAPKNTLIVTGEKGLATSSSAGTLTNGSAGVNSGLLGASCSKPSTSHFFAGIGAEKDFRTELVITNPDETPAQVDVTFLGAKGSVPVPGGPGIEIPGLQSRVIALDAMVTVKGALSAQLVASRGRVAVMARDYRAKGDSPRGADWHASSAAPANQVIIPGVPDGAGGRKLAVANPGSAPAHVEITGLGLQGEFVPAGGDQVDVPPQSTVLVELGPGLVQQAGAVKLTSDQPVTGAIRSDAPSEDETGDKVVPDFAVQTAALPLRQVGVLPFVGESGIESQLVLSHLGEGPVDVIIEVVSMAGVTVKLEKVQVAASSTLVRQLSSPLPAYVVIRTPENSGVYAGLVQRRTGNSDVSGITTLAVSSPDVADRVRPASFDPWTAR
ncbi:DUF5719 family protein [Microlunatus parietis]|uniref:Uncharacterized protein n=1 Tax=Microlunatus parietis TaxID=682979 RepID=A0A7Y9LBE2_9ACTN|nr:DUF5719 family protein [Microlunatus parietis]NYE70753.1 hypothetical protein [Microlunatus parietis]